MNVSVEINLLHKNNNKNQSTSNLFGSREILPAQIQVNEETYWV